jgi:hypothetical protein
MGLGSSCKGCCATAVTPPEVKVSESVYAVILTASVSKSACVREMLAVHARELPGATLEAVSPGTMGVHLAKDPMALSVDTLSLFRITLPLQNAEVTYMLLIRDLLHLIADV